MADHVTMHLRALRALRALRIAIRKHRSLRIQFYITTASNALITCNALLFNALLPNSGDGALPHIRVVYGVDDRDIPIPHCAATRVPQPIAPDSESLGVAVVSSSCDILIARFITYL